MVLRAGTTSTGASALTTADLFGYIGDGSSHTVSSAWGISTLAALVARKLSDGSTPFTFANTFPFGNLFNQQTSAATSSATTLTFQVSTTVANSAAGVAPTTGDYRIWVVSTAGIDKGDLVTGTNIPAGAAVVRVNPYNKFVWLSKALTANPTVGGTVTFTKPMVTSLTTGMTVQSPSAIAGRTISTINTSTGVVTLSGANFSLGQGVYVTFWSQYSDAQAAALQVDGLAIQAAIQAATAAGHGNIYFKGNGKLSHPLVFPTSSTASVSLFGEHKGSTSLTMDRDLGVYIPAISCGDPTASKDNIIGRMGSSLYEGMWQDFTINGPTPTFQSNSPQTQGQTPCWMDGIAWGSRRNSTRVRAQFFYNGWELRGDHTTFSECEAPYCYNSWRFGDAGTALQGDLVFIKCFFTAAFFAGVSVSKNATMNGNFISPYFGRVPIQIYGEPGIGDSYGQPWQGTYQAITSSATLTNAQHEWAGNGSIVDGHNGDNIYAASSPALKQRALVQTRWVNPFFSYELAYVIPGYGFPAYIDVMSLDGVHMTEISANSFPIPSGSGCVGVISANYASNLGVENEFEGDFNNILANCYTANIDFISYKTEGSGLEFAAFGYNYSGQVAIKFRAKEWAGHAELITSPVSTAVPAGAVIEHAGGGSISQRLAQGSTQPLIGVVMGGAPAIATYTYRMVIVASPFRSRVPVKWVTGTANNNSGQWVKVSTTLANYGQIIPATGPTDGQIVGYCYANNGGGNASPFIDLRFQS